MFARRLCSVTSSVANPTKWSGMCFNSTNVSVASSPSSYLKQSKSFTQNLSSRLPVIPSYACSYSSSASSSSSSEALKITFPLPRKTTTGIVGIPVLANGRDVLLGLLKKFLSELERDVPKDAYYARVMGATFRHYVGLCEAAKTHEDLEANLDGKQVEEVIQMVEDEFEALKVLKELNNWHFDISKVPIVVTDPALLDWLKPATPPTAPAPGAPPAAAPAAPAQPTLNPDLFDEFFTPEDLKKLNFVVGHPDELFTSDENDNVVLKKEFQKPAAPAAAPQQPPKP